METVTKYNLDDVFYSINGTIISVWVVNNILISAVGSKVIYELKNASNGNTLSMEEPLLQNEINSKQVVLNTDDLRKELDKHIDEVINGVKKVKKDFMKSKLNRTLHGEPHNADTSLEHIKEEIKRAEKCNKYDEYGVEQKDIDVELNEAYKEIEAAKSLAENMLSKKMAKYWTGSTPPKYKDEPF